MNFSLGAFASLMISLVSATGVNSIDIKSPIIDAASETGMMHETQFQDLVKMMNKKMAHLEQTMNMRICDFEKEMNRKIALLERRLCEKNDRKMDLKIALSECRRHKDDIEKIVFSRLYDLKQSKDEATSIELFRLLVDHEKVINERVASLLEQIEVNRKRAQGELDLLSRHDLNYEGNSEKELISQLYEISITDSKEEESLPPYSTI